MNKILTNQCWKRFCAWYGHNYRIDYSAFCALPFDMQYNIYVLFFDSVGLYISAGYNQEKDVFTATIIDYKHGKGEVIELTTRPKMQSEIITEANKLYNEK